MLNFVQTVRRWLSRESINVCIVALMIMRPLQVYADEPSAVLPNGGDHPSDSDRRQRLAVERMVSEGIMLPEKLGRPRPEEAIGTGEFAVAIQKVFRLPDNPSSQYFLDVRPGSPFYSSVQAVAPFFGNRLLCEGCLLPWNLVPDSPISRTQGVLTIVNVLAKKGMIRLPNSEAAKRMVSRTTEIGRLSEKAVPYVASALETGMLEADPINFSQREPPLSRGELAVLLSAVEDNHDAKAFVMPRRYQH